MTSDSPKRRARFKKGFTPPPLSTPEPGSFQEYLQRAAQRKANQEERLRTRPPLPDTSIIQERLIESTLRHFALAIPHFWQASNWYFSSYPSDFLKKLRLGQYLDCYDKIIAACRKTQFPTFQYGKIEMTFPEETEEKRKTRGTPKIYYHLAETAEWADALPELQRHLGFQDDSPLLSENAQKLIDLAANVPEGTSQKLAADFLAPLSHYNRHRAVSEAQVVNPRLSLEGDGHATYQIVVAEHPLPLLALPSLDVCLNLPSEPTKHACDTVARKIEQIVEQEYREDRLTSKWLVLVRTKSRHQALKSFGHLDRYALPKIASKLKPIGMVVWWTFEDVGTFWTLAVRPDDGMDWSDVVTAIRENANDVPSTEKYRLSKEAAALFDWLRRLPRQKFEWGLSPELTDEILKTEIGLKNPWNNDNAFLFFRLLTEEISRQTSFGAVAHPWSHYGTITARIEFRPKPASSN